MSPTLDDPNRKRKPPVVRTLHPLGKAIPFYPGLAAQIGFNDALLLLRIDFWLHNLRTHVKEIEGVKWLNLSAQEMYERGFEHLDRRNINRTIERLVKRGLLQEKYLPDSKTRLLTLNYKKIEALGVEIVPSTPESTVRTKPMSPARRRKAMASLGKRIKKEQEDKKRSKSNDHTDFLEL